MEQVLAGVGQDRILVGLVLGVSLGGCYHRFPLHMGQRDRFVSVVILIPRAVATIAIFQPRRDVQNKSHGRQEGGISR